MAISETESYVTINNQLYKIIKCVWDYYGGARISSSMMVKVEDKNAKIFKKSIQKNNR